MIGPERTLRIAIVGSGPSGCYTAQFLRKRWEDAEIVIFDRLDQPYGLIRYGVAPDHVGTKAIAKQFDRLFTRDRVRFVGAVEVGRDITVAELSADYDAVVLATGLWGDRTLDGFCGADGQPTHAGVYGAGAVTRMINDYPHRQPGEISIGRRAVIIGNGNVAVDLIRLLLVGPAVLARFQVPEDAIAALNSGPVESIDVVGRSELTRAKFDPAMIRELGSLADVRFTSDADRQSAEVAINAGGKPAAVQELVDASPSVASREVRFHFGWTPDRLEGPDGRLERVAFRDTAGLRGELVLEADSVCTAVGFTEIRGDALVRKAYESEAIDLDRGVLGDRLYCVGWLRRGPTGTIPTSRIDARIVADAIIADLETTPDDLAGPPLSEGTPYAGSAMKLTVLYGTESGNAEMVADELVDEFGVEMTIRAIDMSDATLEDLAPDTFYLVVCSTHGDGELPASAIPFAELLDDERPDLAGVCYAMFGLGDSFYEETYSRGSEHIDERLTALGATRVGEYGRHDASDGSLPNATALEWARNLLSSLEPLIAASGCAPR